MRRDPLIGMQIGGRYRIHRIHAQGGMSVVYAATYEAQQREVAIKVIDEAFASDPKAVERFMHEARTASSVSHGHVVGVSDFGRLPNGRPYLVMPMITGKDFATLVAEHGPLPATRVAGLLSGVASALDWMHAQRLVHRDIKSENIMYVRGDDGTESALVLDFGIAARASRDLDDDASGTPDFMAPEVLAGEPSDHRADVYSLATVAFELLAGRLPFQGKDLPELLRNRAKHKPRTLTEVTRIAFHPALEATVARGLARNPQDRPSSAGEFVRELSRAAARARAPLAAPPPSSGIKLPLPRTAASKPAAKAAAKSKPFARLRTLVGLPFKPSANAVPEAAIAPPPSKPLREPSIVVDLTLPPLAPNEPVQAAPPPPEQPQPEPAPRPEAPPVLVSVPEPAPEPPWSVDPLDSLRPIAELELERDVPTYRNTWRIAVPAAAAIGILAIALWIGSNDSSRTPPSTSSTSSTTASPLPKASEPRAASPAPAIEAVAPPPPAPAPSPVPAIAKARVATVAPDRPAPIRPAPARSERAARAPREQTIEREAAARPPRSSASAQDLSREAVDAMLRGDFANALAKFQAATDASPRYAPAHRGKGLVYERMNRPKDAANAFRQYLRLEPNAADAEKIKARLAALE
jgi:serine/threonine-protein kinase